MSSLQTIGDPPPQPRDASRPDGETAEFQAALAALLENRRINLTDLQRRLLAYLGRNSLGGQNEQLKEYTIGVEAFGKPVQYNPQEDSSVRVQAGRLRQRLDDYYEREGRNETIVIRLPKGGFRVVFEHRRPPAAVDLPAVAPRRKPLSYRYIIGALIVLQLITGALLWRFARQPESELAGIEKQLATPAMLDFWRGFLEPSRPATIAVGSPLFARFDGGFYRDARYQRWEDLAKDEKFLQVARAIGGHFPISYNGLTGIGELSGVFVLSRYLFSQGKDPGLRLSGSVSWDDFRTQSVILLGSYKTFPYWSQIAPHLNFALEQGSIINRIPQAGEPASWASVWSPEFRYTVKDYAIVTKLTGFDGIKHLLLIEAGSGEAELGACQYLTDPRHAEELRQKIDPWKKGSPASFQVVLASTCRAQVPLDTTYVTHRVVSASGR